jgi:hypothetical protein
MRLGSSLQFVERERVSKALKTEFAAGQLAVMRIRGGMQFASARVRVNALWRTRGTQFVCGSSPLRSITSVVLRDASR